MMRSVSLFTALVATAGILCAAKQSSPKLAVKGSGQLVPSAAKQVPAPKVSLPVYFEPNLGQAPDGVDFVSRTPGAAMLLSATGAQLTGMGEKPIELSFRGSKAVKAEPQNKLASYSNYFIGSDPKAWRRSVPHYASIKYRNIYPGVDVVYYGKGRELEYDFIVAPGVDPQVIQLSFAGADSVQTDRDGNLLIQAGGRIVRQIKPKVYQLIDGAEREIEAAYRISGSEVRFALARYDDRKPLIIDPVLQVSTYLGGSGYEVAVSLATDNSGNVYLTGQTNSLSFVTNGPQQRIGGATDAIVAKFAGENLAWVNYFGGRNPELGFGIAVDSAGNPNIVGFTASTDLPVRNATYPDFGGELDAFVAKFNSAGTELIFATYLGGALEDIATATAVDSNNDIYVVGTTSSSNFPTRSAFQSGPSGGGRDVFVTKFPANGGAPIYSTYVGGNGNESSNGIAVDRQGAAYVTGGTNANVFPLQQPVFSSNRGATDAFVFKLAPAGNTLQYSTFVGGNSDDIGYSIGVDPAGNAYFTGYTRSTDLPVRNAAQPAFGGAYDVFVGKISAAGNSLDYLTYLGGSGEDFGLSNLAVDSAGTAYVTGYTSSPNFPMRSPSQATLAGGRDGFLTRLSPDGRTLLFSTYFGGSNHEDSIAIALDRQGQIYVAGRTESTNFPGANNTLTTGGLETRDIFLARYSADTAISFLSLSRAELVFTGRAGQVLNSETITLGSTGQPIAFTAFASAPWIQLANTGTSTPSALTVSINTSLLSAGENRGTITINAPTASNGPFQIPVVVNLTAVPIITGVTPNPVPRNGQATTLTITGSGFNSSSTVFLGNASLSSTLVDSTSIRAVLPAALLPDAPTAQVAVRSTDVTSAPFTINIGGSAPVITQAGIVSSATNQSGFLAPGMLISIFGTNLGSGAFANTAPENGFFPTNVSGVRVLFDGTPAPITGIGANQINAVVPFNVQGKFSVQVVVENNGQQSGIITFAVASTSPGLFTVNNTGTGQAAALNEGSTANSPQNPAARGSQISLFATGFGQTTPESVSGLVIPAGGTLPRPLTNVRVTIGGIPAEVTYSGAAPGAIAGAMQVNARIPDNLSPGDAVPVVVEIEGRESRAGVTIAIR